MTGAVVGAGKHGGRRPGAGRPRKTAAVSPPAASKPPPRRPPPGDDTVAPDYAQAKAEKEYWDARLKRQEFEKRAGDLLDRAEVEQGTATLFSTIAQTIRGWPDNLERVAGLTAEQAEILEKMVDGLCLTIQGKVEAFGSGAK